MVRCWSAAASTLLVLLALALLHAHSVAAQGSAISFGFTELTAGMTPTSAPTPTPTLTQKTSKPKKTTPTATATPIVTTAPPVVVTAAPVATLPPPPPAETRTPPITSSAPTASPNSTSSGGASTDTPPVTTAPSSDAPTTSSPAAPVTTPSSPPATLPPSHDCNAATVSLVTEFYEHNNVLEGTCAAVNDYYRFPFEGVPSRAQLLNMSKTSACTVLMQALLQLVASECDFKRVPLRSTAEAILQLARNLKQIAAEATDTSTAADATADALLPSSEAITQAIQTRRKELLNITSSTSSSSKATDSATASSTKTTTTTAAWTITPGITSVNDDGQHILMDKKLLVVGTYRDKPHAAASSSSSSSSASNEGAAVVSPKSAPKDTLEVDVASTRSDAPARSMSSVVAVIAVAWSVLLLLH